jgi:hypothetical protein
MSDICCCLVLQAVLPAAAAAATKVNLRPDQQLLRIFQVPVNSIVHPASWLHRCCFACPAAAAAAAGAAALYYCCCCLFAAAAAHCLWWAAAAVHAAWTRPLLQPLPLLPLPLLGTVRAEGYPTDPSPTCRTGQQRLLLSLLPLVMWAV